MSNKRRRKRLNKTKLIKEVAREVIGSPPPTKVKGRRRAGSSKYKDQNPGHYMHVSPQREEHAPNALVLSTDIIARTPVMIRQRGSGERTSKGISLSPEVVSHMNYLRESKGDERMTVSPTMSHTGTVEAALAEAKEKAIYFRKEALAKATEAEKWERIVVQLQEVNDLVIGKTKINPPQNGAGNKHAHVNQFPKGHWNKFIKEQLMSNPMPRTDLLAKLVESGASKGGAYQTVYKMIKDKVIEELEGKMHWLGY